MTTKLPTTQSEFVQEIYDSLPMNYGGINNAFTRYAQAKTERAHIIKAVEKGEIEYPDWLDGLMKEYYDDVFEYYFKVLPIVALKRLAQGEWPQCHGHFDKPDTIKNKLNEIVVSIGIAERAMEITGELENYY